MKVLFHKTTETDYSNQVLNTVCSVVADEQVHVTCDTEAFINALLKYRLQMPTVVIQVGRIADVLEIKDLSDILDDLFLIMAADGSDEGLLLRCRQLYPRLLTYYKEDLGVIAAVIEKRLSLHDRVKSSRLCN